MRFPLVFGGIALVLGACAPPTEGDASEPTGASTQSIVGGSASSSAQDATVLISERGRASCSGTLIASNLVLTARHCVAEIDPRSDCGTVTGQIAASTLTISVGANASPQNSVARGAKIFVPTNYNELCRADIALLSLDTDVTGVTPAKLAFGAATKDETATAVGYGDNSDQRTQRSDVTILAVGPATYTYRTSGGSKIPVNPFENEIVTTESTCFGDSGGPLIDGSGRVFAVASRGIDDTCHDRPTYWTTLKSFEAMIRDAAKSVGHPLDDAASTGSSSTATDNVARNDDAGTTSGTPSRFASDDTAKKTARDESGGGTPSSGCSTSPAPRGSSGGVLLALAFVVATLRRPSLRRPSSSRSSRRSSRP